MATSAAIVTGFPNLGDGSVSQPSLAFQSDSDTGLYRIGANTIGIATNGAKVGEVGTNYGGFIGNAIQVINTLYTSNVSLTGATSDTLKTTGIVGSITTRVANSKILILINCAGTIGALANYVYSIIYRHTSTWSSNVTPVGTSLVMKHVLAGATGTNILLPHLQIDDPLQPAGTTLYYGNAVSNNGIGTTIEINYDPAGFSSTRAYANITLMEIMV